ncbi:MAG: GNAT family N-acetyltransferase [Kiritimatiellae bacterium]|nr:GNAT family N-acetyltransferase [Kiritimatiellia bacterium]
MKIRLEEARDWREAEELTREAFWNVYRPGCTEHYVLHRYRSDPAFVPELDFVMEGEDGRLVGNVMFSKAELALEDGTAFPVWTFGPIGIRPDRKRQGLGLRLLLHALEAARGLGVGALCMEGNIEFYKHAGFGLASRMGIRYHAEPPDAEVPYFLARELVPGYLRGIRGTYRPPRGYFVAEEDPGGFAAFEATFPAREKALAEGQLPQFCQSCGRRLVRNGDCGTGADGRIDFDYCRDCFAGGRFLRECTMEEMVGHCVEQGGDRRQLEEFLPMLKRWRGRGG